MEFQLAQLTPGTIGAQTLFSATTRAVVTKIVVCNARNAATTYSIYHDDDGTTFSTATALYKNKAIAANVTEVVEAASLGAGLGMRSGGRIGVDAGTADAITFSAYGIVQQGR